MEKSQRVLGQVKFINCIKKTAVSIYMYIHNMKLCVKGQGEDVSRGSMRGLRHTVLSRLKG